MVASLPKLWDKSPRNPCNEQKMCGSKCWSSQPDWQKWPYSIARSSKLQYPMSFSSLKVGKLTFTQRPLPDHAELWLLLNVFFLCGVPKSLITSCIRTLTPWWRWASRRTYRNAWCPLSLASSTMSNWALSVGIIGPCHLPIGCSLIQASHPIIYITGASQVPDSSSQPLGVPWAPDLHFLHHDSICNSSMAFLHYICTHFHLHCSPSPMNWTCQVESNILALV